MFPKGRVRGSREIWRLKRHFIRSSSQTQQLAKQILLHRFDLTQVCKLEFFFAIKGRLSDLDFSEGPWKDSFADYSPSFNWSAFRGENSACSRTEDNDRFTSFKLTSHANNYGSRSLFNGIALALRITRGLTRDGQSQGVID